MNIVIPMAGKGSRFKRTGVDTPKMLVSVLGKPMFCWAIQNLPQRYADYLFICLREHIELYELADRLRALSDAIRIVVLDKPTQGQACTVLMAKAFIDNDEPLIIHNADTYFECDISPIDNDDTIVGAIPYYRSVDPNMSFIRMDDARRVLEVAEKEPISDHATIGLYYFARGRDFVWAAEQMIARNVRVRGEYYVGPAYNELIARGDRVIGIPADAMWDLGTPEKAALFERTFRNGY
jgi:dTDP-glucose pyrophosphorylase